MLAKNLFISIVLLCSFAGYTYSMEQSPMQIDQETIVLNDETLITVNLENDDTFTIELPYKAAKLSQLFQNTLADCEESNEKPIITIPAYIGGVSPRAFKSILHILNALGSDNAPSLEYILSLTANLEKEDDIMQFANAAAYLNVKNLQTIFLRALKIKLTKITLLDNKLKQALQAAQIAENIYHATDLLYSPLHNQITSTIKSKKIVHGAHSKRIISLAYAPNGTTFASASWDKTIKIWDAATGTCIKTLSGHKGNTMLVTFSPDSKQLLSCCDYMHIKLWDIETGRCLTTLKTRDQEVNSLRFLPRGTHIGFGSTTGVFKVYKIDNENLIEVRAGELTTNNAQDFSPDGKLIASDQDNTIKIWDIASGSLLSTHEGHENQVIHICFSPTTAQLASAEVDATIKIWACF